MRVRGYLASAHWPVSLCAVLGIVLLRALPNLRYPLGRDQATYCVIGQGLLHGGLLYRDFWDNKPPGIFYTYALIVKVFGHVMWSVGVVDIIWLSIISICIYYFAKPYLGAACASLSVIFYAFRHCRQGYIHAAQPETFLTLCIFAAWFLLSGESAASAFGQWASASEKKSQTLHFSRCFSAGLLLGAAFWLKYNAVIFFPFLVLVPFLDFREWDRGSSRARLVVSSRSWASTVSLVAAGFLLGILSVLLYFRLAGAWPAMKEVQFEVLPRYAAQGFQHNLSNFVSALSLTRDYLGAWTEFVAALSLLIAWRLRELRSFASIALLALAGYLCTAMQGHIHDSYFETCYPFFAMLWGYLCEKTWQGFQHARQVFARLGWRVARATLWLVLASLVFALIAEESVLVVQQYEFLANWWRNPELSYEFYYFQPEFERFAGQLRVIDFLKATSRPDDEVYIWGTAPLITFLAQRRNPSRFVSNLALISTWGPERWRQELVRTLAAARPRYVIVESKDSLPEVTRTTLDSEQYLNRYPALSNLLKGQYKATPHFHVSDFEIYERK
jgi:hypothetical protein